MGHIVTHQSSLQWSVILRRELEQADSVALTLLAEAGYAPAAFESSLDRIIGAAGHQGSWLANVFGLTTEDQHRIHKLLSNMNHLPDECVHKQSGSDLAAFHSWQTAVLDYTDVANTCAKPARRHRPNSTAVHPAGRFSPGDLSPDGNWLVAVDDDHAHLLKTHPFGVTAAFPAHGWIQVRFDSSSSKLLVLNGSGRIDVWDIAQQKRTAQYHLTGRSFAFLALSPDATTVAIVDAASDVQIVDGSTNQAIWRKHCEGVLRYPPSLAFSPDGRYFVAMQSHKAQMSTAIADGNGSGALRENCH